MEVLCEEAEVGICGGEVLACVIEGGHGRIAVLCESHREQRSDIAVRDWGALVFPAARTAEVVGLYRAYHDARKAFVQRYDAAARCIHDDGGCGGGVTAYYFSSGETRLLCVAHVRTAPVVCDAGMPISEQYYGEVYEKEGALSDAWRRAMAESRDAARGSKT